MAIRGFLQIPFLLNPSPRRASRTGQAKNGVSCEVFTSPVRQRCKGMFDPQFLAIFVFDKGFGLVRIGVVATHPAQPAPFRCLFFIKVKFPYDIKIRIPVVRADHDVTGLGEATGNILADAPESNITGALLLPQQVGLMGKQMAILCCPAQKQRLLVEMLCWSFSHWFILALP